MRPISSVLATQLVTVSVCVVAAFAAGGCEKTTHENIDKWRGTEKGPGKLEGALKDGGLDPDLRAHAAQNLVHIDRWHKAIEIFDEMEDDERQEVLAKLAPRLWNDARLEEELEVPQALQVAAKDALYDVRRWANDANRETIDGYLTEWLTGGYYSGRAKTGRVRGATIVRAVGSPAAKPLMDRAKAIIAAPVEGKKRPKLERELLRGLAATGDPEAAGLVLSLVHADLDDETLPREAIESLYDGYVDNGGLFEVADAKKGLGPHLDALAELAKDESQEVAVTNRTVELVVAVGMPECLEPLVGLVSFPHDIADYRWLGSHAAIRCGGVEAIIPVAEALPTGGTYRKEEIEGAVWKPIAELDDEGEAAARARTLLASESWVARLTGIEVLGMLAYAPEAGADAARLRELSDDRAVARGWWGDQSDVPREAREKDPTVGARAVNVAKGLEELAKNGQKE